MCRFCSATTEFESVCLKYSEAQVGAEDDTRKRRPSGVVSSNNNPHTISKGHQRVSPQLTLMCCTHGRMVSRVSTGGGSTRRGPSEGRKNATPDPVPLLWWPADTKDPAALDVRTPAR